MTPEQGEGRYVLLYTCPRCGSVSLEAHPCFYNQQDGSNHGRVERLVGEYIERGKAASSPTEGAQDA